MPNEEVFTAPGGEQTTETTEETTTTENVDTTTENVAPDWRESVDEEFRSDASLADIKDINSMVKSYINAQKLIGGDKVAIPKEGDVDGWNEVYNKLGRPSQEDGYELTYPDKSPEGWKFADEYEKGFKKMAHKSGMTARQAKDAFEFINETTLQNVEGRKSAYNNRLQEEWSGLRKEWGNAFDQKMKDANKVMSMYDKDGDFSKWIKATGAAQETSLIKLAAAIGGSLSEDKVNKHEKATAALTPAEAGSKIKAMYADPEGPLLNKKHPSHDDAVKKLSRLQSFAHPEKKEK